LLFFGFLFFVDIFSLKKKRLVNKVLSIQVKIKKKKEKKNGLKYFVSVAVLMCWLSVVVVGIVVN